MNTDRSKMINRRNAYIKNRRKAELRRKFFFSSLLALFIVLAVAGLGCSKSFASDGSTVEYYKYFKTVEVRNDVSLIDLASEYANPEMTTRDLYIQEVLFINNLDSLETPISGKYIIIPYYDTLHS